MYHIPDVDFLEQIFDSATVRLAPNDAESATIVFDTGVAQGSITSLQLFNIFINAPLRMLTINKPDEACTNTDDRIMLVQHWAAAATVSRASVYLYGFLGRTSSGD